MEFFDPHRNLSASLAQNELLSNRLAYNSARRDRLSDLIKEEARLELQVKLTETRLKPFVPSDEEAALRSEIQNLRHQRAELNGQEWVGSEDVAGGQIQKTPEHSRAEAEHAAAVQALETIRNTIRIKEKELKSEFDVD